MSPIIIAILIVILVIVLFLLGTRHSTRNTSNIVSGYDGLTYKVHNAFGDKEHNNHQPANMQAAANIISVLNGKAITLFRYLKTNSGINSTPNMVKRLFKYYNPDNLIENSPKNLLGDTSFTYNNGSTLAMCLREKDPTIIGKSNIHDFHDINTLTFVFIHELAHISISQSGHPPIFWKSFKKLLLDAANAGIINLVDYALYPVMYCGMPIDSNPVYDL